MQSFPLCTVLEHVDVLILDNTNREGSFSSPECFLQAKSIYFHCLCIYQFKKEENKTALDCVDVCLH